MSKPAGAKPKPKVFGFGHAPQQEAHHSAVAVPRCQRPT